MKCAWTLVIMAMACGGGGNTPGMDGGISDATDSAPDSDPTADTDGDGVLDAVDVCPMVPDPAQVDLDGDHIGWMCDPIESTTIQHTGIADFFKVNARGDTAGASFAYGCSPGPCQIEALSVGPGGVRRAKTQTDAWLMNGRPSWGWVSGENRVLWSFLAGGLGEHSAVTGAFTTKYDGNLQGGDLTGTKRFERDQLTVLPSISPTQGFALLEPRENGDVFVIAESARNYPVQVIAGRDPANFLFAAPAPTGYTLKRFAPGGAASTVSVGSVILTDAYEIAALKTRSGALVGVCVDKDNVRYFIPTDDNTAPGQVAPLSGCHGYAEQTTDRRLQVLVSPIDGFHPTGGVAYLLGGVMRSLSITPYAIEVIGASVPAAVRTMDTFGVQTLTVIDAAGTAIPMAANVTESIVAAEGNTIHVLAKRGADRVLIRYRNGTVTEVTMPGFTATAQEIVLLTTKEGAALISTYTTAFVVPSQAMTVTTIDFDNLKGFVRGNATLFFASRNAASSRPALYSYSEVGGVPQYTALTPEAMNELYALRLDATDGTATPWFFYVKDGMCTIARPEVTGGAVTLAGNAPCLNGALVDGVTRDNKLIAKAVANGSELLYLIDGNTITKVAASSRQFQLMYAAQDSKLTIGWIGADSTGAEYVCLGTHPDRCWPTPTGTHTWAAPVMGQPDSMHVVYWTQIPGTGTIKDVRFTSIRAIGPGTRPQPL